MRSLQHLRLCPWAREAVRHAPRRAASCAALVDAPPCAVEDALLAGGLSRAQVSVAMRCEPRLASFCPRGVAARLAYFSFLRSSTYGWLDADETVAQFVARQPASLERSFEVVAEDERYIALSKPWDTRHDVPRGWPGKVRFTPKHAGDQSAEEFLEARHPELDVVRFAHQLDFGTSGLLLACKTKAATAAAANCFAARSAAKTYRCLLMGHAREAAWSVDAAVGTDESDPTGFKMKLDPEGKASSTSFRVLRTGVCALEGPFQGVPLTLAEATPRTGRRHQIRLHAASSGLPILGDCAYSPDRDSYRMFLHAHTLFLPIKDSAPLSFVAPVPGGFDDAIA